MSGWKFNLTPIDAPKIDTKYRSIVTKIPVPESLEILDALDRYESTAMHGQLPVVWDRAEDFLVYDAWGNRWIDFTSTIFVANAGHGNARIIDKSYYDAFYNSELEKILKSHHIEQLFITGVMAHLCCETTARSAFTRGFEVFFTIDGTATYNSAFHLGTLMNLAHGFAIPMLINEAIDKLNESCK